MQFSLDRFPAVTQFLVNIARRKARPASPVVIAMDDAGDARVFAQAFRTVIDIGAHAGEFTAVARGYVPHAKVFAFEPLPGPYRALAHVIARCAQGSRAFPFALGDADDECTMCEYPFTPCSSLLPAAASARRWFPYMIGGVRRTVRILRLDDVLAIASIERPALLKIDVQGYEDRVLRGAVRTLFHVDSILIETSMVPVYDGQWLFPEMRAWLEERGFSYSGAVRHHRSFFGGTIVQEDSLFTRSSRDQE